MLTYVTVYKCSYVTNVFRYDKALTSKSVRLCLSGNICPLDAVVTMNSYYRASRLDCKIEQWSIKWNTGWHITLSKTSRWPRNKSSALADQDKKSTEGFGRRDVSACTIQWVQYLSLIFRSSECESGDMADFLRRFSSNCLSLIYLPSHRLPAPLRKQMFMDIG